MGEYRTRTQHTFIKAALFNSSLVFNQIKSHSRKQQQQQQQQQQQRGVMPKLITLAVSHTLTLVLGAYLHSRHVSGDLSELSNIRSGIRKRRFYSVCACVVVVVGGVGFFRRKI